MQQNDLKSGLQLWMLLFWGRRWKEWRICSSLVVEKLTGRNFIKNNLHKRIGQEWRWFSKLNLKHHKKFVRSSKQAIWAASTPSFNCTHSFVSSAAPFKEAVSSLEAVFQVLNEVQTGAAEAMTTTMMMMLLVLMVVEMHSVQVQCEKNSKSRGNVFPRLYSSKFDTLISLILVLIHFFEIQFWFKLDILTDNFLGGYWKESWFHILRMDTVTNDYHDFMIRITTTYFIQWRKRS